MKLSTIVLAGLTKPAVTDNIAISTLKDLTNIGSEILSSEFINQSSKWKQRWTSKFQKNSDRMQKSFGRCGSTNGDANAVIKIEYDTENPCQAINLLIDGFSLWTERNLATCDGQKKNSHQKKRFAKFNNILNKGIGLKFKLIINNDSLFMKSNKVRLELFNFLFGNFSQFKRSIVKKFRQQLNQLLSLQLSRRLSPQLCPQLYPHLGPRLSLQLSPQLCPRLSLQLCLRLSRRLSPQLCQQRCPQLSPQLSPRLSQRLSRR